MSQKVTIIESNYATLIEAVAGALDGKEDQLLSLDATGKAVLFDGTAPATHVMVCKLQAGETQIKARILGKNGTVRVIQDAAITPGARVSGKTGTARVETAAAGSRSLGFKLDRAGLGAGAQGDVIEVSDVVEQPKIPTVSGAMAPADGVFGGLNSTAVNPTKADFDALLAQCEILRDTVATLHAALITQKVTAAA